MTICGLFGVDQRCISDYLSVSSILFAIIRLCNIIVDDREGVSTLPITDRV